MNKYAKFMKVLRIIDLIDTVDIVNDLEDETLINNLNEITCDDEFSLETPHKPLRDMTNPIEMFSEAEFKFRYSFCKKTVVYILELIVHGLERTSNRGKPVPPLIELLITIKFMTTGTFQSMIDDLHGVSQPTISRIIVKVSTLLAELRHIFIQYPCPIETRRITKTFYSSTKFPKVLGCLGATHVGIKNPGGQISEAYLNEHGYYSLRVQVHQLMLQDAPRNAAYHKAIFDNKNFIKGKTVLDVGAGTGILSVFCAQAGAAKVYAVEASEMYKMTEEVAKENNFENIIEVFHTKVENLDIPGDAKVDIIVSEWMGFYLLHEGMLESVIFARDKFLKEGGYMFPETATIYSAPCSLPQMHSFWDNINGVSMKCVGKRFREWKCTKPEVLNISKEDLLGNGTPIFWIDMRDITIEEIQTVYYKNVDVASKNGQYQGLCLWFTCQFPAIESNEEVILSTSPEDPSTHWKQTVIVYPSDFSVEEGAPIAYELSLSKSKEDERRYNIEVSLLDAEEVTHPEPCTCHMTKCILIKKMLEQYESGNMQE